MACCCFTQPLRHLHPFTDCAGVRREGGTHVTAEHSTAAVCAHHGVLGPPCQRRDSQWPRLRRLRWEPLRIQERLLWRRNFTVCDRSSVCECQAAGGRIPVMPVRRGPERKETFSPGVYDMRSNRQLTFCRSSVTHFSRGKMLRRRVLCATADLRRRSKRSAT